MGGDNGLPRRVCGEVGLRSSLVYNWDLSWKTSFQLVGNVDWRLQSDYILRLGIELHADLKAENGDHSCEMNGSSLVFCVALGRAF